MNVVSAAAGESPWLVTDCRGEGLGVHVHPTVDSREHQLDLDCWCEPFREPDYPQVIRHCDQDRRAQTQGKTDA